MAIVTGTATDYKTMLADFITFITTNASLVSGGQNWSVLRTVTASGHNDHLLRGPGLAGTDQIHVRLQSAEAGSNYGWNCNGFVSYNSALANDVQPGSSPVVGMALRNATIPYWFLANGRRFMIIAKVSTYYMSLYGGFILPWATPAEYPYPLYVGGSHVDATTQNYTLATAAVGSFWKPAAGCAYLRDTAGAWLEVDANFAGDAMIFPYAFEILQAAHADGSRAVWPCILIKNTAPTNIFGVLDGVHGLQYTGVSAEDTFTLGGKANTVFPSVYMTTKWSYAGITQE